MGLNYNKAKGRPGDSLEFCLILGISCLSVAFDTFLDLLCLAPGVPRMPRELLGNVLVVHVRSTGPSIRLDLKSTENDGHASELAMIRQHSSQITLNNSSNQITQQRMTDR